MPMNFVDWIGLKLCLLHLPGLHGDFAAVVDEAFAAALQEFVAANESAGVDVTFDSAFRPTDLQAKVGKDPSSTTPAAPGHSSHEAGFAVDINWNSVSPDDRDAVVSNANAAGLSWGGNFKRPRPDPVHFFMEVPGEIGQRPSRIDAAQRERRDSLLLPDCKKADQCRAK
jgi:D-alanyl-D-alanine carboxypeptidase